MRATTILLSLGVFLVGSLAAVMVVTVRSLPVEEAQAKPALIDADLPTLLSGKSRDECRNLLGEPDNIQQHYESTTYEVVAEYWLYRRAALSWRTGNAVHVQVWWDMSTGHMRRISFYDPDSGEVLR